MARPVELGPLVVGFALPTLALVTALHLQRQPTLAEGVDGLVSGLAFTAFFAAGAAFARVFVGRFASPSPRLRVALAWGAGMAAFTWAALWAMWQALPPVWRAAKVGGFTLNGSVVVLAGALAFALWSRSDAAHARSARAA